MILFQLGPLTFYSYGVVLSLAIMAGIFLVWREGKREGFAPEKLLDLALISLFGGVVGGRVLHVLLNFHRFRYSLLTVVRFWEGEPVWYGVLLGGFAAGSWFSRRNNWSIYKIGDVTVPALALGQAVGYLGCGFSGCAAPVAWPVSVFYLGLFTIITRLKREKTFIGFPALFYLVFSTLFDFIIGFFRRTPRWWLVFNFEQLLAIGIFVTAVLALRRRLKKSGMKTKLKLPKKFLQDLRARLKRSEKEMEQQKLELVKQDPYLQEGRTEDNAEFVDDAGEDIGHTRIELLKGILDPLLREIKRALAKMHLGTYGICGACKKAIDRARLKANPAATLCLRCERKKELAPVKKVRRGK